MKKMSSFLTAALLVGGLTTTAIAHDRGEASMQGTINKIDHSTGAVELKTDNGTMELNFTPDSVKNFKEGQQVVLELESMRHEAMEKHAMEQKH